MSSVEIIKAIFIFDKKSGRPFIRYMPSRDFKIESFLVIGFLTAIMRFSKEVGRSDLKMIDMENLRFVFTEQEDVIFNAITTKLVKPLDLMFKLNTISTIFLNEFSKEELNNTRIPLEYYEKFLGTIDEIMHGNVRSIENTKETRIKEILIKFNEDNQTAGSGVLSFTGDFLVSVFNNDADIDLVLALFNSVFETKVSGINRFTINIKNQDILIIRIDEETLFVVIGKENQPFTNLERKVKKVILKIGEIIKEKE